MKKLFLLILLCFYNYQSQCQTLVEGFILNENITNIQVFLPVYGFSQAEIPTSIELNKEKKFSLNIAIDHPYMITLNYQLGGEIKLLLEPQDTIYLEIDTKLKKEENMNWLKVRGNNAEGHIYLNAIYDFVLFDKYARFRNTMDQKTNLNWQEQFIAFQEEFKSQSIWLDSLADSSKITKTYQKYLKTYIKGALIGDAAGKVFRKQYKFSTLSDQNSPFSKLTDSLFTFLSPKDEKIRRVSSLFGYIYNYYRVKYYKEGLTSNSDSLFFKDEPSFIHTPNDIHQYLTATCIVRLAQIAPDLNDYCQLYKKHLKIFGKSKWTDEMERLKLCSPKILPNGEDVRVIENQFEDIFNVLSVYFSGERLLIDLWATWCGPCKAEFKHYDEEFYTFLNNYQIKPVFISIDSPDQKYNWEKEIRSRGPIGYHILANQGLINSIKTIIFQDEEIMIPRYVLVDENGVILTSQAARPSTSDFRTQIEEFFERE